jgi:hypothetical protein
MATPAIPTGARCTFSLNGQVIAYARSVAISEQIDYQPIEVLDLLRVKEFIPTAYRVTLTASMFRIVGQTLKSMNFFPKTGQNGTQQLINVLNVGDLVATLEDSVSGAVLATVQGVKIASHSFSIDSRGIVSEDVDFVCTSVTSEDEAA